MSNTKRCKQCGILKQAEDFRKYTYSRAKGTEGRYTICKACESINTRYNLLVSRAVYDRTEDGSTTFYSGDAADIAEIRKIESLYKALEDRGLKTPLSRSRTKSVISPVDQIFQFYGIAEQTHTAEQPAEKRVAPIPKIPTAPEVQNIIPSDLQVWLDQDMQEWIDQELSPEFLQETIYESLKATYRPQIGVDQNTYMPIYDDTYKDMLNSILRRFDEYEEMYASIEEETDNG